MSKIYEVPVMEIEKFRFEDVLTTSMGTGDAGDNNTGLDNGDDNGFVPNEP